MADEKPGCSQLLVDETKYGEDFRRLIDALFCACLSDLDSREKTLQRNLFRLVDLEGLDLSEASRALGISRAEAKDLQEQTRREIAVLLVLGLGVFETAETSDTSTVPGCECGSQGLITD